MFCTGRYVAQTGRKDSAVFWVGNSDAESFTDLVWTLQTTSYYLINVSVFASVNDGESGNAHLHYMQL